MSKSLWNRQGKKAWMFYSALVSPIAIAAGLSSWNLLVGQDQVSTPVAPSASAGPAVVGTTSAPVALGTLPELASTTSTVSVAAGPTNPVGPLAPAVPVPPAQTMNASNPAWATAPATTAVRSANTIYSTGTAATAALPPNTYTYVYNQYDTLHDSEDVKLGAEAQKIASQLRSPNLDEEDEKDIKAKLQDLVAKQFRHRQDKRKKELDQLKKQVADLEKGLEDREQKQKEIIDRRVAELLGQSDPLGWDYQGKSSGFPGIRYSTPPAIPPGVPAPPAAFLPYQPPATTMPVPSNLSRKASSDDRKLLEARLKELEEMVRALESEKKR